MIERIAALLKPHGVTWFDLIEASGMSTPLSFKNNRIHSLKRSQSRGYGIRINWGGRTGFSFTNDPGGIDGAVMRALELARYGEGESFTLPGPALKNFDPYDERIENFVSGEEMEKGYAAIGAVLSRHPGATIDAGITRSTGSMRILNSRGLDASYRSSSYSFSISATLVGSDGAKLDVWEGMSSLYPGGHEAALEKLLGKIEKGGKIRKLESGRHPVIFTPKAASGILGIVTSGLSGRSVAKGTSPFAGKLGEKMFNSSFSFHDNPLMRDSPFSYPFDDEGVPGRDKALIEAGVIRGFIADLKFAEKLRMEPTGNGTRGYSDLPSPGFSNKVYAPGTAGIDEIIRSVDRGILADQFIGLGQSNTLTGDFSAGLDLAYAIEKGEITGRIKDCMITDNLFRLLAGDMAFSNEAERAGSSQVPYLWFPAVNYTG